MRTTARFAVLRRKILKKLFTASNLAAIWRSNVWKQMRNLDISDLHDYYDFNYSIEERANEISLQILQGQFKASNPLIYKLEKKYGICRHIMIPSPSDALVFQTITEHLAKPLKEAEPTNKAYYSRDKHHLKLPHQFKAAPGYPWFVLWPKFQKDIYKFTKDCKYLVVTDISNYFDNIGLRELRHVVSSRIKADEVILDLLFNIIEQISWTPDYLPTSLKGLPTINLEAFRLLPHVLLFEIDEVLEKQTAGNFVRWMDDINFGVDSKEEAHAILGSTNDVLKSRGLALNLAKTIIYKSSEAKRHFVFNENNYLNKVAKADPNAVGFPKIRKDFVNRFRKHLKKSELRNWDRVMRRYYNIAAQLDIKSLRRYAQDLFLEYPGLRDSILRYLGALGFSDRTARIIKSLLLKVKRYDDVILFNFVKLLTTMKIPRNSKGKDLVNEITKILANWETDFDLYCYIWFSAKYLRPNDLLTLLRKTRRRWMNEQFLARQAVASFPRVLPFRKDIVAGMIEDIMTSGPRDAASVAANINGLISREKVESRLYAYLFSPKPQKPYPLAKFLILMALLSSPDLKRAERKKCVKKASVHIKDEWYLHWLKHHGLLEASNL